MSQESPFVYMMSKENTSFSSTEEYLRHCGKWLIYAKKPDLDDMIPKVKMLVGTRGINQAKYTKGPAQEVPEGYEKGIDHVMIVYCDDRENKDVKKTLQKELGVEDMYWKYDWQTYLEAIEKGAEVMEPYSSILARIKEENEKKN